MGIWIWQYEFELRQLPCDSEEIKAEQASSQCLQREQTAVGCLQSDLTDLT